MQRNLEKYKINSKEIKMINIVINSKDIKCLDEFNNLGQINQHMKPNNVVFYLKDFSDIKTIINEFSPGTYFVCEIDVPFDYSQNQKSKVEHFLNSVLSYNNIECELCFRKIFSIVV
jgi:hypothetical protein